MARGALGVNVKRKSKAAGKSRAKHVKSTSKRGQLWERKRRKTLPARKVSRPGAKKRRGKLSARRPRGWSLSSLTACRQRLARLASDLDAGIISPRALPTVAEVRRLITATANILQNEAADAIEKQFGELEQKILALKGRIP